MPPSDKSHAGKVFSRKVRAVEILSIAPFFFSQQNSQVSNKQVFAPPE